MGGGASKGKATGPSLLKAISNTDVANQLFDEINRDGDLNISIVEAYDAMKKYGEAVEAYWSLDMIKTTIAKYDTNQDGKKYREEFLGIVGDMKAKHGAPKGKDTKKTKLTRKLTRAWTWKKIVVAQEEGPAEPSGGESDETAAADANGTLAELLAYSPPPELTVEQKRGAFWAKQQDCWAVPMGRDLAQMPWQEASPEETGLSEALYWCRKKGKTPLFLDNPQAQPIARHYGERGAVTLDIKRMFNDERARKVTRSELMKEARGKLVEAMKKGLPLHIALEDKVADLIGWCDAESFPMAVFDHRVVEALEPYRGEAAAARCAAMEEVWDPEDARYRPFSGLWYNCDHPFSKVLREPDLTRGGFVVKDGFEVIISTHLERHEYAEALKINVPMLRLQPILVQPPYR